MLRFPLSSVSSLEVLEQVTVSWSTVVDPLGFIWCISQGAWSTVLAITEPFVEASHVIWAVGANSVPSPLLYLICPVYVEIDPLLLV